MKKLVFVLLSLILISWNWNTHQGFIKDSFNELPDELKEKLSLPLMQDGAIIPDRDFQDFRNHSYPRSITAVNYWLNVSLDYYNKGEFDKASVGLGIASHYISDSLSAPHSVSNEDYDDHKLYEDQAKNSFNIKCKEITIEREIIELVEYKKNEWNVWLDNKDASIPKKSSEEAANLVYDSILNFFNVKCAEKETDYTLVLILIVLIVIALIFIYCKYF